MKNKAQASIEYMIMLGVSLLIFAAIIAFSINMVIGVEAQIAVDSAYKAVEEIKEAADFVYVHGHPSKIKRVVRVPGNVENMTLEDNLVKMEISTGQGYTDIYDVTRGNITGTEAVDFMCSGGVCRESSYVLVIQSMDAVYDVNITAD